MDGATQLDPVISRKLLECEYLSTVCEGIIERQERVLERVDRVRHSVLYQPLLAQVAQNMSRVSLYQQKLVQLKRDMLKISHTARSTEERALRLADNLRVLALRREHIRDHDTDLDKALTVPVALIPPSDSDLQGNSMSSSSIKPLTIKRKVKAKVAQLDD